MKILFAVSNENIAEAIKREYQNNYKLQLMAKNVYYFNAIIKELQNNKTYDVVIISEDLEPFANNNYDTIDKFLSDKLLTIREEAVNEEGTRIPIIFITTDRHMLGDSLTAKLYEIGIYNALVGNDRSIENVCTLMFHPRNQQEAKAYYRVNAEIDNGPREDDVKEEEIKNIIAHYKKLGKAEEKYVESFDNIASQYNDAQLKVIIRFLPLNVKAVLEAQSLKYQSLTTFANNYNTGKAVHKPEKNNEIKEKNANIDSTNNRVLEQIGSVRDNSNVIIPNAMNINSVRKIETGSEGNTGSEIKPGSEGKAERLRALNLSEEVETMVSRRKDEINKNRTMAFEEVEAEEDEQDNQDDQDVQIQQIQKEEEQYNEEKEQEKLLELVEEMQIAPKRGRGRPKKNTEAPIVSNAPKRGRGRPRKDAVVEPESPVLPHFREDAEKYEMQEPNVLPGFDDSIEDGQTSNVLPGFDNSIEDSQSSNVLPGFDDSVEDSQSGNVLPGFDDSIEDGQTSNVLPGFDDSVEDRQSGNVLPGFDDSVEDRQSSNVLPGFDDSIENSQASNVLPRFGDVTENKQVRNNYSTYYDDVEKPQTAHNFSMDDNTVSEKQNTSYENIEHLIPADKRIATFIGTSKSGVSFIVNNLAQMLTTFNINVAILDLTKNKNSFYIYTNNNEGLRNQASKSIYNLIEGNANGVKVNNNLTLYTALPTDTEKFYEADKVLKTLLENHSVILIDADYDTPIGYFDNSTDIFMVQNMDILTMQPLTTFLKGLKAKNVLKNEKLKLIINMESKVAGINPQVLLGALAVYKDPGMAYTVDLYKKELVKLFAIPFDISAYNRYLTGLVECNLSLKGYSKTIISRLKNIALCIYPLLQKKPKNNKNTSYMPPSFDNYNSTPFNGQMNSTLSQMKNKY